MAEPVSVIEVDDSSGESQDSFSILADASMGFSPCNSTLIPVYLARNGERNSHLR
jgi:hypothetical protein